MVSTRSIRAAIASCCAIGMMAILSPSGFAQSQPAQPPASDPQAPSPPDQGTFKLGEIVYVLGKDPGTPGVGGSVVSHEQMQTFERNTLDRAVNLVPGVVATFDANGRRNESDIFVRGFGRQQVPLMADGVRIYLPADNRLDFARFLTADVAEIQIQKGYASVLDGPGASDVRDLIQTVVLPDTTTQTQNVGNGDFSGFEVSLESPIGTGLYAGGNYTSMHRVIKDALQPNLRPTGVPTNRAFLYATWRPVVSLRITPSLELADDRWSDVNPPPAFPYVKTGAYSLLDQDATYAFPKALELSVGLKNLLDDYYELAWGYPQPGRTFYVKTRMLF